MEVGLDFRDDLGVGELVRRVQLDGGSRPGGELPHPFCELLFRFPGPEDQQRIGMSHRGDDLIEVAVELLPIADFVALVAPATLRAVAARAAASVAKARVARDVGL